jgi:hypothetical protein
MSEVATGCGSTILPRMYNGDEPESDATNQWKIQPRPPKGANRLFHVEEESEFGRSLIGDQSKVKESGDLIFVILVALHMPQADTLIPFFWSCGC